MVAAEPVPLKRRFGDRAGERVAKILSDNGVRFLGSTTVTAIDDTRVHLDTGATLDGDVVVSACGVRPDPHLAEAACLDTEDGRIVVDEHMHTSALNVYAAGDVALAYNVTAGRRIRAEHWRDAAQQGLIAGLAPLQLRGAAQHQLHFAGRQPVVLHASLYRARGTIYSAAAGSSVAAAT